MYSLMSRTWILPFLLILLALLPPPRAAAQQADDEPKVYQLSGMVLDRQTGIPIAYAKITTGKRRRLALTNQEGFFSIPVTRQDTLFFKRVGYKPSKLSMKDYLAEYGIDTSETYIYEIHYLFQDTVQLPTVTIHPYQDKEDVKVAIRNMPSSMDVPIDQLRGNVNPAILAYFMEDMPENEKDRVDLARRRYEDFYTKQQNMAPVAGVDAGAVFRMIRYMDKKNKERKQKALEYWSDE